MAPFRDVFSALFFVSVGMLFNPGFVTSQPLMVLVVLGIVIVINPLVAVAIVILLRDTPRTALTVAVGLSQIGEFSFILAMLGQSLDILPTQGMDALVVAALISIALNPLLFRLLRVIEARKGWDAEAERERAAPEMTNEPKETAQPVVIAGLGEVGRRLAQRCADNGVPVCVIDGEFDSLEELRNRGIATVFGDPGRQDVLRAMGLANARMIVVTNTSLPEKMTVCIAAREVNPRIAIVATAGSNAERAWLQEFGAAYICDALDEMTQALLRAIRSGL